MKNHREEVERMRQVGYISTQDATALLGRGNSCNDHQRDYLINQGISYIMLPMNGEHKRTTYMWKKSEVEQLKQQSLLRPAVAGDANGGKIMHKLAQLEERVAVLENYIKPTDLMAVCNE